MNWKKKSHEEIRQHVFGALRQNKDFNEGGVLGIPASYLDPLVFNQDSNLLDNAPYLTTMVSNPNHIGCHTLGNSEHFFRGTQAIERAVIQICAEDIFKADPESYDGYVASGGTEANIQALWIYRNYFIREHHATLDEIAVISSVNSHYSMAKGANLLGIRHFLVQTDPVNFGCIPESLDLCLDESTASGVKYFVVVANMMTTMFGSVDDPSFFSAALNARKLPFKMHIDAAYGGFYYPFSNLQSSINFTDPNITSFTLDAHKMAQAPYGTGIFLIRKGYMQYATTKEASYVVGEDSTLIGSRSGANAVAIWMILATYGRNGWIEKIFILQKRTDWLCQQLEKLNVSYFRDPHSNIVTIQKDFISDSLAQSYGLVPDDHHAPKWFKIVVMDHVLVDKLEVFLKALEEELKSR